MAGKKYIWLLLWLVAATLAAVPATIYEIQYTTVAGDGTYPSLYNNQSVTTTGIVTAKGYSGDKFFISMPEGGAWKGVYVFDYSHPVNLGDEIEITGTVYEYYGFTEIKSVTGFRLISTGNPIPVVEVPTATLANRNSGEAYESVLVKVRNVTATSLPTPTYNEWYVTDGSGPCQIDDTFFTNSVFPINPTIGMQFRTITGVMDYGHNEFGLNPRTSGDIVIDNGGNDIVATVTLGGANASVNQNVEIPITVTALDSVWAINKFNCKVSYQSSMLEFLNTNTTGTLLANLAATDTLTVTPSGDTLYIYYSGNTVLKSNQDGEALINLEFKAKQYGTVALGLQNFSFNTTTLPTTSLVGGTVTVPITKKTAYLRIFNSRNDKNIFNPRMSEKITIEFGGISNSKAIVRVYDAQGRMVATLFNQVISSPNGLTQYQWDGRDSDHNLLPIGVYICHVEVIDRSNGGEHTTSQPIVIGAPLK